MLELLFLAALMNWGMPYGQQVFFFLKSCMLCFLYVEIFLFSPSYLPWQVWRLCCYAIGFCLVTAEITVLWNIKGGQCHIYRKWQQKYTWIDHWESSFDSNPPPHPLSHSFTPLLLSDCAVAGVDRDVYKKLVADGTILPQPEVAPPTVPMDFNWARVSSPPPSTTAAASASALCFQSRKRLWRF